MVKMPLALNSNVLPFNPGCACSSGLSVHAAVACASQRGGSRAGAMGRVQCAAHLLLPMLTPLLKRRRPENSRASLIVV